VSDLQEAIDRMWVEVARLHGELVHYGLVVWTAGNVSGRVPGTDLFVIKPSGCPTTSSPRWPTSSAAIPVGPFAIIGDDSIGRGIVETLRHHRSRAVLMRNHGPFTIGVTPWARSASAADRS
jgi:ribulose-5-phosphate 4-epimerase/fuculose-1-phosphate aldolase